MLAKFRLYENYLIIGALIGVLVGFWYVEELSAIKIFAIILAIIALILAFWPKKNKTLSSQYEFLGILVIYLGIYSSYSLLYTINLPLYIAMLMVFITVVLVVLSIFSLEKINTLISKEITSSLVVLFGLIILEVFLALYFLSIDPLFKTLFITVIYYFLTNLVYLYVNSMLRLKRIIGYLVISIIILAAIFGITWMSLPR